MKRYIQIILNAALAVFALASCNDVVLNEKMQGNGYLNVCLQKDESVLSKAIVSPSDDMTFRIDIYSGQTLMASIEDHRSVTQDNPVTLPVGTYRVVASYGDNTQAGFDNPCYSGETEVLIKANQTEEAEIVCTLSNVMVTVNLADNILENFTACAVTVDDGNGHSLVFSQDADNLDAVAYIPATGILNMRLSMVNADGQSRNVDRTFFNVKAQQHYRLRFALMESAGESGYGAIKLVVDDAMIDQTLDLELDFSDTEEPSMNTNPEFDVSGDQTYVIGDATPKVMTFNVPEGIESVRLSMDQNIVTRSSSLLVYELVDASADVINALNAKGIKVTSIQKGAVSATVEITDYVKSLATGEYNFDMAVYDMKGHVAKCELDFTVMADVDADVVSVTPWAKFAIVSGKFFTQTPPEGLTFMYRKTSEPSWTSCPTDSVKIDAGSRTYEAEIGGLDASSQYVIKAVTATDTETREVEFTTSSAKTLYNMGFEDWYQDGKVYFPYKQGADPSVWDCANKATASFGIVAASKSYTTSSDHSVSGLAARLESENVVIKFAAGNLYTGKFGSIIGTSGASLEWGTPFTSRPIALRGYYDYTSGTIDKVQDPYKNMSGQPDKCQILCFLTDWEAPFTINTVDGVFVDFSEANKSIIAFGKIESEVTTNGYKEFTLPLEYRDLNRTPTYIVIACCSSYLGDYFTGSTKSEMYVDEFSFEYDATKLNAEQKAKVNYR